MPETITSTGIKKQIESEIFVGQSDIVVFDAVADYKQATFESITASGESVGQVSGDSSEYAGEDATTEAWKDEQGKVITSTATDGTVAIKYSMANLSKEQIIKYLNGVGLDSLTSSIFKNIKNAVGFGVKLPVITRPVAWLNDTSKRCLFMPKSKIVSNIAIDGKKFMITSTATAEYLDKPTLKTAMIFDADPTYAEAEEEGEGS